MLLNLLFLLCFSTERNVPSDTFPSFVVDHDCIIATIPQYNIYEPHGPNSIRRLFQITIPQDSLTAIDISANQCTFHYPDSQRLIIFYRDDTTGTPDPDLSIASDQKFKKIIHRRSGIRNVKPAQTLTGRKSENIRKTGYQVFMLAIKEENFERFKKAANTLRILPDSLSRFRQTNPQGEVSDTIVEIKMYEARQH